MKRLLLLAGCALMMASCASPAPEPAPAPAPVVAAAPPPPPPPPDPAPPVAARDPLGTPPPAPAAPAAPAAPVVPVTHSDYSKPENWLCRPGIANNACAQNIDATIVQANGSTTVERFTANANAPIDCFYVYPTVSLDPFTQSDLVAGPEELNVVRAQFARFGSQCRMFAPMYRQFSLGALRARMAGTGGVPSRGNPGDAAADIDDAWAWYLANENHGRGVVLIGHSQGSGQIIRLLSAKVDGKPDQARLVSAIILGGTVQVPPGQDKGGTFQNIPVCRTASQTGCIISYSSFRDNIPPSATAGFGINRSPNVAVCTNPAALAGGRATAPKAYFSVGTGRTWSGTGNIATPFVMTPGLVTTECVTVGNHTFLQVHLNSDPADKRIDDPLTDVMANGAPDPAWGLHLVDANLGMGDLVDIVRQQGAAWRRTHP
jgi:hypothetical protein